MEYDEDGNWNPPAGFIKSKLSWTPSENDPRVQKWTPEIGKQTIDFIRAQYLGPKIITKFKQ